MTIQKVIDSLVVDFNIRTLDFKDDFLDSCIIKHSLVIECFTRTLRTIIILES